MLKATPEAHTCADPKAQQTFAQTREVNEMKRTPKNPQSNLTPCKPNSHNKYRTYPCHSGLVPGNIPIVTSPVPYPVTSMHQVCCKPGTGSASRKRPPIVRGASALDRTGAPAVKETCSLKRRCCCDWRFFRLDKWSLLRDV